MLKLALFIPSLLLSGVALGATAVSDNFDAGLEGWVANTTQTTISNPLSGGNPDGYLFTHNRGNPTSFGAVGAMNMGADYSGVFADGLWTISVDLNFFDSDFSDAWLRFRYHDATFNGWHYSLTNSIPINSWDTYTVTFDTTWSNLEAMANGWVQETLSVDFAVLWDDVYTSEVRLIGNPQVSLFGGIDNYEASYVPVPAAVWLMISGMLGLIGISRLSK